MAFSEVLLTSTLDVRSLETPVSLKVWLASDESLVTDADTLAGMLLLVTAVLWSILVAAT